MTGPGRAFRLALAAGVLAAAAVPPAAAPVVGQDGRGRVVVVAGEGGWVDSGVDVQAGQRVSFRAEGLLSLQRGNPAAECGPAGLDLRGLQQPLPARNLGELIGKVCQTIDVKIDEDTGEEVRDEIVRLFGIGVEAEVEMPLSGRLYLGVNETVVQDNTGAFRVTVVPDEVPAKGGAGGEKPGSRPPKRPAP